jgi:hypothetical protein
VQSGQRIGEAQQADGAGEKEERARRNGGNPPVSPCGDWLAFPPWRARIRAGRQTFALT